MPRKLILDVDTGTDDAIAIMLAALHPKLELVGCTTVTGNLDVKYTTDNTLRVLDHIGRSDVPVHQGLAHALTRGDYPGPRRDADIPPTLAIDLPAPQSKKADRGAVEFLIETYRAATEEIELVPVAPLTNIAAAIALDPKFVDRVPEIVIMGGANATGNETSSAEFNIWCDPEAASIVFSAGFRKLTLVTLDATVQGFLSDADCDRLVNSGTPAGRATVGLIGPNVPIHDAVCVASLLDPEILQTRALNVKVETGGSLTVGRTVMDLRRKPESAPNCHVALNMNSGRFARLLVDTFTGLQV